MEDEKPIAKPPIPKRTQPKKRTRPSRAKKTTAPKRESIASLEQLSPQALAELRAQLAAQNLAMFPEAAGVQVYSDESLQQRQAKFEEQSAGTHVIRDEWQGQLETGRPFDDIASPFQRDNPDKHFRYLSTRDAIQKTRGKRGYTEVKDKDGKTVSCAGMPLCWIPKEVQVQREAKRLEVTRDEIQRGEDLHEQAQEDAKSELGSSFSQVKSEDGAYYGNLRQ